MVVVVDGEDGGYGVDMVFVNLMVKVTVESINILCEPRPLLAKYKRYARDKNAKEACTKYRRVIPHLS